MTTPIPHPSPIANFIRWLMAWLANCVHLMDGAHKAAIAPLPTTVRHVPSPATMKVWGQVFEAAGELVAAAALQIADAFMTDPIFSTVEALAMVWLVIETVLLTRTAIAGAWKKPTSDQAEALAPSADDPS